MREKAKSIHESRFKDRQFGARDTMQQPKFISKEKDNRIILKDDFHSRTDPSIVTSSTRFIWPVKWNKFSFSSIETQQAITCASLQRLLGQIQV